MTAADDSREAFIENLWSRALDMTSPDFANDEDYLKARRNYKKYCLKELDIYVQQVVAEVRVDAQIVDKWVAYMLENIYPLDVFSRNTKGDTAQQHIAGIYHGAHILRREVRELSARDDLSPLPQETEEYYTQLSQQRKSGKYASNIKQTKTRN